ncbi:MAG: hypothetical protein GX947_01105 [Tissierellia bacterium]|nr:hypothetical protein [Tissierellia bacterium]
MNFKKETYTTDMEILVTEANLVTFSGTVAADEVETNEDGRKIVLSGSLIDADGKVVKETGDEGSEELSSTPVGVLYKTVDVTNGAQPAALIVEGYLRKDRVIDSVFDNTLDDIKAALPKITFR